MKKNVMSVCLLLVAIFSISGNHVSAKENIPNQDKKQYEVVFKSEGGQFGSQDKKEAAKEFKKKVEEKKAIVLPVAPVKEGFTFAGWYSDQKLTKVWDLKSGVTSNLTLFAKWEVAAKEYQVNFNSNGGSGVKAQMIKENQVLVMPQMPVKEGFLFGGWFSDQGLTTAWDTKAVVTANKTLFAKWDAVVKNFQVNFNTNGGSGVAPQTVQANQLLLAPQSPIKEGFLFDGWFSDAALTKPWEFTTPVTAETTLYASWRELVVEPVINDYTITFNTNGGSVVATQKVTENGVVVQPQAPTKAGFVFGGWYSDQKLTKVWDFKTPVTGELTLYAKWNEPVIEQYTVTFNVNGGSNVASQKVKENDLVMQPKAPTKTGFVFGGWYSDQKLTKVWNFKTAVTSDLTLYAKWDQPIIKPKEYTVSFDVDGGSKISPQKIKENDLISQPKVPTKVGFVFGGWYSDQKLTKAWDFKTAVTSNLTLYAKWDQPIIESKEYTISFNVNGGSNLVAQKVKANERIAQPQVPTKEGFVFGGWYSDQKLTKAWDFKTVVTSDLTLYAKWEVAVTKKQPITTNKQKNSQVNKKLPLSKSGKKLPQTGERKTSSTILIVGTLLLIMTFTIIVRKMKQLEKNS